MKTHGLDSVGVADTTSNKTGNKADKNTVQAMLAVGVGLMCALHAASWTLTKPTNAPGQCERG